MSDVVHVLIIFPKVVLKSHSQKMDPVVVSKINHVKIFQNLAALRIANCTKRISGKNLIHLSVQNNLM